MTYINTDGTIDMKIMLNSTSDIVMETSIFELEKQSEL